MTNMEEYLGEVRGLLSGWAVVETKTQLWVVNKDTKYGCGFKRPNKVPETTPIELTEMVNSNYASFVLRGGVK